MRWLTLVLAFVFLFMNSNLYAQADSMGVDTEPSLDEAWGQIRQYHQDGNHAKADSVQRKYAQKLFDYYQAHPTTEKGREFVSSAFMMWGNVGAADAVDTALTQVRRDQEVWRDIIQGASNAFARSDRYDEFVARLQEIAPELAHPNGQATAHQKLGRHFLAEGDTAKARSHFEAILELDANSTQIRKARGKLYELDSLRIGHSAPDFTAETISGREMSLSELRGQVVLLEFWATNCGPCLPQIPHLKQLHEKYAGEGFTLIGISQDDSLSTLREFLKKREMEWPQIRSRVYFEDGKLQMGKISELYNVFGIPRSFLIDRNGKIVAKDIRDEEMVKKVESALKPTE